TIPAWNIPRSHTRTYHPNSGPHMRHRQAYNPSGTSTTGVRTFTGRCNSIGASGTRPPRITPPAEPSPTTTGKHPGNNTRPHHRHTVTATAHTTWHTREQSQPTPPQP